MTSPIAGQRIGLLSAWASRANGGVFEAVTAQVAILRQLGATPVVLAVADEHDADDRWRLAPAEVIGVAGSGPVALAYAPGLAAALDAARLDLLHLNGIWQYPSHAAGAWARRTGRPLIVSPHGMLADWIVTRNGWKKDLARLLWERRSWAAASLFHALSHIEAGEIARAVPAARTTIIANAAPRPGAIAEGPRPPHALYLGRIHPKKNILALIAGWRMAQPALPADAQLTIAGWGDDAGIAALEAAMVGDDSSVAFVDTAFGSQKAALFDLARFLVLPSLSEGLPMAVLEAWAAGVPTIMSSACNLPEGIAAGAALECATDPHSIARTLVEGFALGATEWTAMSRAAVDLARGQFGHEAIARRWSAAYAEAFNAAPRQGSRCR